MSPRLSIIVLWGVFWASWLAAAAWAEASEKRLDLRTELPYRAVLIVGVLLFAIPAHSYRGPLRFWQVDRLEAWICVGVLAAGLAFAWWARIYLGPLWSTRVAHTAAHRVVDRGPYALVRHPIYTGLLLATFATAAAKGTLPGLAGAALITVGVWMKARLEERFLGAELGAAYAAYRQRVPMLVPFI